ncbi:nicotinate-nucleotide adenylyltransferase [Apilactobacillus kunkeei]|uniref:Probable nicotinate-nucleotide adenylyltransferase n=3 Tax=Apilactobacillus kunkeei TaxID=148814 RepID=A0A087EQ96_9LACO|nr:MULTISPECIES: nicotinate-nucleotide adenylyltransferase [Lactobacillaceae]MBI0090785.1 nicotinate-nucleotide adenylyltransferase [Lactobacillus sp. M0345]ALJ31955.1 nicotinic acid mononucleotide adenylyltransferase [Apilactobacillus kunkeei]KDB01566.1 putative nicotinate-nucleotide adenylyltransferase NadD [Apilactobacillus kunkeei EFB6]KFJ15447.1 nicotinic acid mononucleotide adenylyltransferase [Apilactobacillus kunkeei]KIM19043.1 nicotinic acid mononucleotide adenylyltransferase [Apilact
MHSEKVQTLPKLKSLNKRKKIGIIGGTFNPIHNGHLFIADQVRSQLGLEKVYFMPDFIPPHVDHKDAIDADDRVNMVNLAINDNDKFDIEMLEIINRGKSYTYNTMVELKRRHPDYEYYFIIGGDMVEYLPKWYRVDDLFKLTHFVGVRRENYPMSTNYPVIWVDVAKLDISSTLIRKLVSNHQSIRYLVPDAVLKYIKEHHLYE